MSLADPQVRRMVMQQQLDGFVGKQYIIRFLTSERGMQLNDRKCVVRSHNGERLQAQLMDDGSMCNIKMQNLLPADAMFSPHQGPHVPDEEVLKQLRAALAHPAIQDVSDRDDVKARIEFVSQHLDSNRVPLASKCMEPMGDQSQMSSFVRFMQDCRPCCNGDGTADFRRFNAGLVGAGEACPVCMEVVGKGEQALGFPCGHLFHNRCAASWLKEHNTCPSCRFALGMPGEEYTHMFDYEDRVGTRIREWFISGMCERCQAAFQEADPLCTVDVPGGPPMLVPRSKLGKS